jgi:pyruvate,orthophosphate dikinase
MEQLWGAIGAVFSSWNIPRAVSYREIHGIPDDWGTAVNVQSMVFGNMGDDSGHRRGLHPGPGHGRKLFLRRIPYQRPGRGRGGGHPHPAAHQPGQAGAPGHATLEDEMPKIYKQLVGIRNKLEKHYKDMEDIEFTIQQGKLWMLQTRTGKRTAPAAIKIAVDLVKEKLISKEEAVTRVDPGAA